MAKPLLTDELWERIKPYLPAQPPNPKGGRPPIPNRQALTGILFVLKTGIPWEYLPQEMGCGSGMTCWRRLRDWELAGVWDSVWQDLLDELGTADAIDWSAAAVDSCSTRALFGGRRPARILQIVGKNGSKRHLITDGNGTPLAIEHYGGALSTTPIWQSRWSMPFGPSNDRKADPANVPTRFWRIALTMAEDKIRQPLRDRGIQPLIPKRNTDHGSGLGKYRWVVEAAFAWLYQQRRLRVRYEKRDDIHQAFLNIGCLLICWNRVAELC